MVAVPLAASDNLPGDRRQELRNVLMPDRLAGKSIEYLSSVILNGRPGTAMPAWRSLLSPAEARWMATQLLQGELQ
jgi:cytochrome c55X